MQDMRKVLSTFGDNHYRIEVFYLVATPPTTKRFHKKRKLRISIRNGDNVQGQKKYEAVACQSFGLC